MNEEGMIGRRRKKNVGPTISGTTGKAVERGRGKTGEKQEGRERKTSKKRVTSGKLGNHTAGLTQGHFIVKTTVKTNNKRRGKCRRTRGFGRRIN